MNTFHHDTPRDDATQQRPATVALPTTIPAYLAQLRRALEGADPALAQDALYDAEEYLRAELAENPGRSEAEVIAAVASSYGAPDEVADIYRDTEVKVQTALRPPAPRARRSLVGRFFGVLTDPYAYGGLFYMLLSVVTGTFYFSWVVTGMSLSLGMLVLIIGVPLLVLFIGSVRVLALVEGRLVEGLLGERMPRRPLYADRDKPWLSRIGDMFTDLRTWATMLYLLLMLPLGIAYFTFVVTMGAVAGVIALLPLMQQFRDDGLLIFDSGEYVVSLWWLPLTLALGLLIVIVTLHIARAVGRLHGQLAKHMLVKG